MHVPPPRYPHIPHLAASALLAALAACSPEPSPEASTSLYALVEGIDGVYFYPPLGPEPSAAGTFEATLLDGLSVVIEQQEADGSVATLASFDQHTVPAVALLAGHERYWVNIPAATYLTDRSKTYQVRVLLDGSELGRSVLSDHIFDVMAFSPQLPLGVQVRVEGSGAVRSIPRARLGGTPGRPLHCSDGVRNKDESGVDCGGSCGACQCNTVGGSSAGAASCGWYCEARFHAPGSMDSCIASQTSRLGSSVLVAANWPEHPCVAGGGCGGCDWRLWVGYFCPSSAPHAVAQASGGYRCYPNCPAGTTLIGDRCVCN